MSEAPIPAWKRVGLKRAAGAAKSSKSAVDSYDPLQEGLKRVHESGETKKPAKPPKRQKLAKADRPAPTHELDQLAYLRQYAEDRANWKFSKQKQNWLLKHMFSDVTDDKYDGPLLKYIEGLQGASREWVVEDARKVVSEWNEFMLEEPLKEGEPNAESKAEKDTGSGADESAKAEKGGDSTKAAPENGSDETEKRPTTGPKETKKEKQRPAAPARKVPTEKMARRAQAAIKLLANEDVRLELLDPEAGGP